MKKISTSFSFLISAMLISFMQVSAQESVNSAGGDATGSGGSAAYSIGQVVYTTATGSGGTSEQGVQHAYEIFTVDINETPFVVSLTVFPNPTADKLNLQISNYQNERLRYQLFDLNGKLILDGNISSVQTIIDMGTLPTAEYLVKLMDGKKKIQTFKIFKIS